MAAVTVPWSVLDSIRVGHRQSRPSSFNVPVSSSSDGRYLDQQCGGRLFWGPATTRYRPRLADVVWQLEIGFNLIEIFAVSMMGRLGTLQ